MENRIRRIFLDTKIATKCLLACGFLVASMNGMAQDKPLIEPDVKPQVVDESLIDSENFEFGASVGMIQIEDFGSSSIYGAKVIYHLSEYLFFEGNYVVGEGEKTSFETLGNVELISDRDYTFYNFGLGLSAPGQIYLPGNYAFNTNTYFLLGAGSTEFGGDSNFTASFGAGYQLLLTDWLSIHISAREHLYRSDFTGEDKLTYNIEFSTALTFFF